MVKLLLASAVFCLLSAPAWAQMEVPQQAKNGLYAEVYVLRHDFSLGYRF